MNPNTFLTPSPDPNPARALPIRTVLLATDLGSPTALRYAQAIAHRHNARLILVHVIDPDAYPLPLGIDEFRLTCESAHSELHRLSVDALCHGVTALPVLEIGVIDKSILHAVREHHADLLILGTRLRTESGRAALGAITRRLLTQTGCPVIAIPADSNISSPHPGEWRRILAATDFSPESLAGLERAQQLAYGQLRVLHVRKCKEKNDASQPCTGCTERMRQLAPMNESHTVPVEHHIESGDVAEQIATHANAMHADLVVLGAPSSLVEEEDMRNSTVMRVIARVNCPILCVPAPKRPASLPATSGGASPLITLGN